MPKRPFADSALAQFVAKRILELRPGKNQSQIAAEAGFRTPNLIAMLKSGATKLPLDRVPALAKALECDPRLLLRLTLEQDGNETAARAIAELLETIVTKNEAGWLAELRNASDDIDPPLTARRRADFRRIFGK